MMGGVLEVKKEDILKLVSHVSILQFMNRLTWLQMHIMFSSQTELRHLCEENDIAWLYYFASVLISNKSMIKA